MVAAAAERPRQPATAEVQGLRLQILYRSDTRSSDSRSVFLRLPCKQGFPSPTRTHTGCGGPSRRSRTGRPCRCSQSEWWPRCMSRAGETVTAGRSREGQSESRTNEPQSDRGSGVAVCHTQAVQWCLEVRWRNRSPSRQARRSEAGMRSAGHTHKAGGILLFGATG